MKQFLKSRGLWLSLGVIIISLSAKAQLGEGYYVPSTNSGQVSHGVGTGAQSFSIFTGGSYDASTYGIGVDNFIGPNGVAGAQEIGGVVAPIFDTLKFNNGAANAFNITNTAGIIINNSLAFNNGITTTVRTNRVSGLSGAIQFSGTSLYTPTLTPVAGSADAVFVDGYVSKVNPSAFVYPVGNVTDLRPITATGTGTFTTAWSTTNVATPYPYTSSTLPIGTSALNTNGYWEWSGTAAATAILTIPDLTSFTTAAKLSVMAYNGTAWTNLGGTFTANSENSTNTSVTIPVTTQALAIGQTVPYVQVSPGAFLQGTMSGTAMLQGLKTAGVIPLTQPYNNTKTNYAGVENIPGALTNMVDWILVDIRDSTTPATIIATKAAILMTDGTITDLDGVLPVTFLNVTPGNYFVGLRHRNHLAIRSAAKFALSNTTTTVDFRVSATSAYTNNSLSNTAMKNLGNGKFAMWGGDANGDGVVRFSGPGSDRSALLSGCLSGNTGSVISGLSFCDFNLDGVTRYSGPANDKSVLLSGVSGGNTGLVLSQHL